MVGYVIVEVEITNRAGYGEFLEKVTSTVEAHGGKFVVRGGDIDVIEGNWTPMRLAVLEFESAVRAREWLGSPEYNELNDLRTSSSNINMVLVEGLLGP